MAAECSLLDAFCINLALAEAHNNLGDSRLLQERLGVVRELEQFFLEAVQGL